MTITDNNILSVQNGRGKNSIFNQYYMLFSSSRISLTLTLDDLEKLERLKFGFYLDERPPGNPAAVGWLEYQNLESKGKSLVLLPRKLHGYIHDVTKSQTQSER